jgi:UDP-2-acetamido-2,6-beta-L-arabino-hexul-4-ose reductase
VIDREIWADAAGLAEALATCDAVIHLAGVNRGPDDELEGGNARLAELLVAALRESGATPHVIFSSSIHATKDSPYGRGKRAAERVLEKWSSDVSALCTIMRLPHVFGECGRPYHNSVVATFCHQLTTHETPRVNRDGTVELLHAQDVAALILGSLSAPSRDGLRPEGTEMRVAQLLQRLEDLNEQYLAGVIPALDDRLELNLFKTLRSYMFPDQYPMQPALHADERGRLFEVVKAPYGGQAFVSTTLSGATRGGHYHYHKFERFAVLEGLARIRVRKLLDPAVRSFDVDGAAPGFVDMPTLHTHDITNIGDEPLITLFWSHELFDPANADTYVLPIEEIA